MAREIHSLTDCCRLLAIDPKTLHRWMSLSHLFALGIVVSTKGGGAAPTHGYAPERVFAPAGAGEAVAAGRLRTVSGEPQGDD